MKLPTPEDFEPWVGKKIRLSTVPEPIEITLLRIERKPHLLNEFREPFTLIFESPEQIYLLDETYNMDCGKGGPHDIYISQIQPRPGQPRLYQANFS
ncbi:DUF6916 family protein [Sphingomonas sp. GlSt437]|uniref:DUF6916 family protein n=1 Tax=Sphingomonas sp. GlSt437 TaxID=3389970 RepID=UPI003A87500F